MRLPPRGHRAGRAHSSRKAPHVLPREGRRRASSPARCRPADLNPSPARRRSIRDLARHRCIPATGPHREHSSNIGRPGRRYSPIVHDELESLITLRGIRRSDRRLGDIPTSACHDTVRKIARRGAADIAQRVLQACGQIVRFGMANDYTSHNPLAGIKAAEVLKPHARRNNPRIDPNELPRLLTAIDGYVGSERTCLALKLMALTFVCTSEAIGAKWHEFDVPAARWVIPVERMKIPRIVPLSWEARAALHRRRELSFDRELVFSGDLRPSKPVSNNRLFFALYRMGYRGRLTGHGFPDVAATIRHEQG